jgi:hypothetical protein
VEKIVERIVNIEVPVEKIVERIVNIEVPVEKIVIKEVPVEIIKVVIKEAPTMVAVEKASSQPPTLLVFPRPVPVSLTPHHHPFRSCLPHIRPFPVEEGGERGREP